MIISHILLLVVWLLYGVLHSLLADEMVKVKICRNFKLPMATYRVLYNIFALGSLIGLLFYHFSVASPKLFDSYILQNYFAPLLIVMGLTGMLICIIKYFRQLSGLKKIQVTKHPILETDGIHRYVRHPLYISTFIFLAGLFLLVPHLSNLIAVVSIIVYTIIGISFEEKKLIKEFGEQYLDYKRNVPMLIPFLK